MIRIEDICEKVRRNHPQADLNLLRRAYLFSAREHKGQKRASGESYLVHPLEVANILADMRMDAVSVSTGLLHDVVEDTLADKETIREYFGEEVAHLVEGLTKIAHISSVSREAASSRRLKNIFAIWGLLRASVFCSPFFGRDHPLSWMMCMKIPAMSVCLVVISLYAAFWAFNCKRAKRLSWAHS